MLSEINELLISESRRETDKDDEKQSKEQEDPPNQRLLIADASCVLQDIRYPIDPNLLNDVRMACEWIIDELHAHWDTKEAKPRTYRQCARRDYLRVAKNVD
jgi:transposase, IS5 family